MRIAVNLASRPFADIAPLLQRLRLGIAALGLIGVALGAGLYFTHNQAEAARARERALDVSIARIDQERQTYQTMVRQPDNAAVLQQVASLNKLIDTKAFSWTLAMEDLETVLPGGVQVTTLEPTVDKKDGHITLHMRVAGPRDKAVELVSNLEHSRRFLLPRIVGETAETAGGVPGQQLEPVSETNHVNFDVLADYNPATAEEVKAAHKKAQSGHKAETPASAAPATPRTGRPGQRPPYTGTTPLARPPRPNPRPNPGGPQ
jgi:type IV pilus assembly protein PilN